eukprot:evm.model.scf_3423.1 EVM.evm.TU.scf_3423.1   scf_3423:4192-12887(+)
MAANGCRDAGQEGEDCAVCVAVHIRPLIDSEIVAGCQACLKVTPGAPQISCLSKSFTFDRVYGSCGAEDSSMMFNQCVYPLVDGLFKGYNATVFAYGQTGSGKTYTMGSAYTPGGNSQGVIPEVLDLIFERLQRQKDIECNVRASFVEIHKEEVRDLLAVDTNHMPAIHVRDVPGGGVCLFGATEMEVRSKDDTAALLQQGSLVRATASTNMNMRSSRSHAIFTITLEQRQRIVINNSGEDGGDSMSVDSEDSDKENDRDMAAVDDYLVAKMHLVDLAGSERAKRTKAEGQRLQEAIDINRGLLALGKVIHALVERQSHVPYRDSKLTRLLQDSLGGNSRTVMLACVSPADVNLDESLNTLRYANRARNIKNKPVVNRDPTAAQIAYLRHQLVQVRAELATYKKLVGPEGAKLVAPPQADVFLQEQLEKAQRERGHLMNEVAKLKVQLECAVEDVHETSEKMVAAQKRTVQLELALQKVKESGVKVPSVTEGAVEGSDDGDVMDRLLGSKADLELENKRLRESLEALQQTPHSSTRGVSFGSGSLGTCPELQDVDEQLKADAEEEAYRLEQKRLGDELNEISRALEVKQEQYQKVVDGNGQMETVKAKYEKVLKDLTQERAKLQKERTELAQKLQNLQAEKAEDKAKLEEKYKEQLREKDEKLRELKKCEKELVRIERLKSKSDDACRRLERDVVRIKQQKVALVKQIEQRQKDYTQRIKEREKELKQLKKQSRAAASKYQRLEAMHIKQQAVLKRKTDEAEASRKRLKEIVALTSKAQKDAIKRSGAAGVAVECQPNLHAPLLKDEKARREWLEREINVCNRSWDLRRVLDGEIALRTESCRQLHDVEKRILRIKTPGMSLSPMAWAESCQKLEELKRKYEDDIANYSNHIAELQEEWEKAKNEEEARQGNVAEAKRWTGLKNLAEGRSLLKTLFKLASDQRAIMNEMQADNARVLEDSTNLQLKLEEAEEEKQELLIAHARTQAAFVMSVHPSPATEVREHQEDAAFDELMHEIDEVTRTPMGSPTPCQVGSPMDASEDEGEPFYHPVSMAANEPEFHERKTKSGSHGQGVDDPALLDAINKQRCANGVTAVPYVTAKVLEAGLRWLKPGWVKGTKTKEQLVAEYRQLSGMDCSAHHRVRDLRRGSSLDLERRSSFDSLFAAGPVTVGDKSILTSTPRGFELLQNAQAAKEKATALKARLSRRCTSALDGDGNEGENGKRVDCLASQRLALSGIKCRLFT